MKKVPDDPRIHQCVLAYLSDWSLLDTATRPHAVSFMQENVQVASLDHAMCGSIGPFERMNGCSTTKTAPAPMVPEALIAV